MACPAAVKMMRKSVAAAHTVSIANANTPFVPFNPDRVALVIGSSVDTWFYLGLRRDAAELVGLTVPTAAPPLVLSLGEHGAMVQGPIHAYCGDGTANLTYWETLLPPLPEE